MDNRTKQLRKDTIRDGMLELRRELSPIIDRLAKDDLTQDERARLETKQNDLIEKINRLREVVHDIDIKGY